MIPGNEKDDELATEEAQKQFEREELELSPYPRLDIPEGEKPDILSYLTSLPDVDVPPGFKTLDEDKKVKAPVIEKTEEQLKAEALAEKIRSRTKSLQVTAYALLLSENSEVPSILETLSKDEAYKDIVFYKGQKDKYYYSNSTMTPQYANIAVLVEEKDYLHTVAQMVRYHAKTYPSPTAEQYFVDPPYNYPKPHMERVRKMLKDDPAYKDIKEVTTNNGKIYLFSTEHMTEVYALSLAERAEYKEG